MYNIEQCLACAKQHACYAMMIMVGPCASSVTIWLAAGKGLFPAEPQHPQHQHEAVGWLIPVVG